MANTITLVRLNSYTVANGHFNVLLRNQLDGCSRQGIPFRFEDLSQYPAEIQLEILLSKVALSNTRHIYFEWLHDIPNLDQMDRAFFTRGLTWSVTASISELWNTDENVSLVFKMLTELNHCKSLETVFVFDELLIERLNFDNILFTPIPQFESTELDTIRRPCCAWSSTSKVTIGVVGQLYGYRGVNKLISIVSRKKKLAIFLWGQERWSSVDPFKRLILSRFIGKKRKYISDNYALSDANLNHAFLHIDALYIDGSSYPSPSGIAVRARKLGVPVLLEDGESYLKAMSFFDGGIIVGNFSHMPQGQILRSIVLGKSVGSGKVPTKIDQQTIFLDAWRRALV
jgi:hypothetical protein